MDFAHEGNFTAKKAGGIGITVAVHALVACGLLYGLHHTFTHTDTSPVTFDPPKTPPVHKEDPQVDKFKLPQDPTNTYHLDLPKVDIDDHTPIPPTKTGPVKPDGPTVDGPPKPGGGEGTGGTTKLASAPLIANLDACKPEYPASSIRAEESGVVRVKFVIGADNSLISASVLRSSGYKALDKAAVSALSQCQFKAAMQDGAPVSSSLVTDYVWSLQNE